MRRFVVFALALALSFAASGTPASAASGKIATLILPITYVSQLSEPAPSGWAAWYTPYCVATSSAMVMRTFGVALPNHPLATLFAIGQEGNSTNDPGIDPDGASYLMQRFGGEGRIHVYDNPQAALDELVGRFNYGSPVVIFVQSGNHAVVAYGYEADEGGTITAIYAADPLTGFSGRVPLNLWQSESWFGPFWAAGEKWQGKFIFVSYRDFR